MFVRHLVVAEAPVERRAVALHHPSDVREGVAIVYVGSMACATALKTEKKNIGGRGGGYLMGNMLGTPDRKTLAAYTRPRIKPVRRYPVWLKRAKTSDSISRSLDEALQVVGKQAR